MNQIIIWQTHMRYGVVFCIPNYARSIIMVIFLIRKNYQKMFWFCSPEEIPSLKPLMVSNKIW
jgi:hypothetical protein